MNSIRLVTSSDDRKSSELSESHRTNGQINGITSTPNLKVENGDRRPPQNTSAAENKSHGSLSISISPLENGILPRVGTSPAISSVRIISAEFGNKQAYPNFPIVEDNTAANLASSPQQWSSAVGKANLGKSGRVIERLMGENDMLKRDIQLERFRAEEARQALKLQEDRMEAITTDYEARLHEAAINKTLLKRKERQVADLKAQVETEKHRADTAVDRERGWREAMQNMEQETKRKVEEATNYSLLMEGRYKALSSHWKEQGEVVEKTVDKMSVEIAALLDERRKDCDRLDALDKLTASQKEALVNLEDEKKRLADQFKAYQEAQENLLKSIKSRAQEQEKANGETLRESQRVLGELKWALGVKKNVKGAQ
jgi:hypothetical protein